MRRNGRKILAGTVFAFLLGLLAFFAADIPFFTFPETSDGAMAAADGQLVEITEMESGNAVFSAGWLEAMMPFTIILLISLVCIAVDVLLRKRLYKKNGMPQPETHYTDF